MESYPQWVMEATKLPIAFAQVREDSLLDMAIVDEVTGNVRMLMVASGGCTATSLAASGRLSSLHLVDPNPAQIALTRLKLHLLQKVRQTERMAILGHRPMLAEERAFRIRSVLQELEIRPEQLGPERIVAHLGLDHVGRYEMVFAQLREALANFDEELTSLLSLRDLTEQARRIGPQTTLGLRMDKAFDTIMTLPNLVCLFGKAATANRAEDFSRHFARRTRHALATLPAADNPYLAQMLLGRFKGVTYHWLSAAPPVRMPQTFWSTMSMGEALHGSRPESYDVIHFSNILDWLSPEAAAQMLASAWRVLAKNGVLIIRQLNSRLDIPGVGGQFAWLTRSAARLHQVDRSFFYAALHLGQKN